MQLGLGPVFAYEWLTVSRKRSVYFFRFLFGVSLLIVLSMVSWSLSESYAYRQLSPLERQAEAGQAFSASIIVTGLSLILLVAPAATAGAICLDKQRGSLAHLMATDLTDAEIVLGKLAARLVPTLGLVLSTLGVAAIATLMGGIDPVGLLGSFLIMTGVAIMMASLAICLSVWASKTHEVIMMTYLIILAWLLFYPIWYLVFELKLGVVQPPEWLDRFHPYFLVLDQRPGGIPVWQPILFFLGCLTIAAMFATLATLKIRSVSSRQGAPKRKRRLKLGALGKSLSIVPGPSLDGNPVAWREWHRRKPSGWTRLIWLVFAVGSFTATAFGVYTCLMPDGGMNAKMASMILVNGFQVSIGLLLLSAAASTPLAEERVRGSLDVLMSTPLSTRSIVWGKWWGTFRTVPTLAVLPTVLAIAAAYDSWANPRIVGAMTVATANRWMGPPLVWGLTIAYGAALTSLGLAMATWFSRLGRAVGATVSLYVLMTAAYCFLISAFSSGPGSTGLWSGLMTGSPWMGLAWTSSLIVREDFSQFQMYRIQIAWASFWILAYLSVAAILLMATVATFNRCLGRMPEESVAPGMEPVKVPKRVVELELVAD